MSDEEAREAWHTIRFAENDGKPFCPYCGSLKIYAYKNTGEKPRHLFKCAAPECQRQFSATSGTRFHGRKMAIRDILAAIMMFVSGANGVPALRLCRELNVSYKTAYVLLHKLRESMDDMRKESKLSGIVEVDGVELGGNERTGNTGNRSDEQKRRERERRGKLTEKERSREDMEAFLSEVGRNAKKRHVIAMRERRPAGRTFVFVAHNEAEAYNLILAHVERDAELRTDSATHFNDLHLDFPKHEMVNHSVEWSRQKGAKEGRPVFKDGRPVFDGIHTNWAEAFNARVRRAQRGVHLRMIGRCLYSYVNELAWREDFNRVDNGRQFGLVLSRSAVFGSKSDNWRGYWQRSRNPPRRRLPAHPLAV